MPTNLLSLPLVSVAFQTATNESWRDSVAFATAGTISAYRNPENAGLGMPVNLAVQPGVFIGTYTLTFSSPLAFGVTDPDGYAVGAGVVFAPFSAGGIAFTLPIGLTPFAAGDTISFVVLPQPIDITGIRFVMQMRAAAGQAQVLLSATTQDQTLINGGASGALGFNVPFAKMQSVPTSPASTPHVLDVIAIADGDQRRCITGTNAVVPGITQVPSI